MTTIHVSKNDPSAFSTLQEAILSIDDRHDETIRIEVAPGIFEEKLFIRKENIEIVGDDPLMTVFRYGDGAKKPRPDGSGEYGTFNTAVIFIAGKDITLRNLTIESTAGPGYLAGQALAVYAAADRLSCYNCRFTGWQDTIFNGDPMTCNMKKLMLPDFFQASEVPIVHKFYRNYFKDCYVCGDVDYIFGPNTAFFDHCEIHSIARVSEEKAYITAASTPAGQEFGLIFSHCRITGEEPDSVYLGRPWRDCAKTAFICCELGDHICPEGWQNWGKVRAEVLSDYIEYGNFGPGADCSGRSPLSRCLVNPEVETYFSKENVLVGEDGWIPAE